MSDKMSNNIVLYQVTVTTEPGMARYEATVRRHIKEDMYRARIADISRINMYGKQPHCIMDELPHLRKYCFCRVQIEWLLYAEIGRSFPQLIINVEHILQNSNAQ